MLLRIFWMAAFLGVVSACGCSNKTTTPTTPGDTGIGTSQPVVEFFGEDSDHNLLGMWNANFNLDDLTVEITPETRDTAFHFNVTSLIPAPEIIINSWDPVTEVIDVDVTIINPYEVDAYDVRLIIYTDSVGHKLQNDDGWTALYEIPGGLPINPFKAYAKSVPDRLFAGETEHTENLQILLPGGNPNVAFAIDASYPGNCLEPHKIGNLSQGILYDTAGSTAILRVGVYDHQNNVDSVGLYLPEITGTTTPVPFTYIGYSAWVLELFNNTGAYMGEYDGFLVASSSDSGSLALYDNVIITISTNDSGWARTWGGASIGEEKGEDVVTDASGNIYVTGIFYETVDFEPGPGEAYHTSNGNADAYLSKFDTDGNFVWVRTWGGPEFDLGKSIDIDDSGNIYVTGFYLATVDFDPGPGIEEYTSNGEEDIYLSRFDSNGNFVWTNTWGGLGRDSGQDVTIDGSGNVFITGAFRDAVDFDPGPGEDWHYVHDYQDVFLSKFGSDGYFHWARTWGTDKVSASSDYAYGVATDSSGNIYVTGSFNETVDFDPGPGIDEHTTNGSADIFLSRFDSNGNFVWARTWGGLSYELGLSVATDGSGNIYVTGYYEETVDFDPGSGEEWHTSNGARDIYLSKFNSSGNFIWVRTWGGTETDMGNDVVTDNLGNIYVTGRFRDVVDFDPGPGEDEHISNGSLDNFLSRFNSNGGFIWARTWGGIQYDKSFGVATDDTGNIFVTGVFIGTIDFDPGPGEDWHTSNSDFDRDSFLIKFLPNGYWE
ncbi:MAG: SBBP repeat-containing protein [bacterium]